MTPNFHVTIVTQEKVYLDAEVQSLVAPGGAGYLGVLANHAPLLTTLTSGNMTLTMPDDSKKQYHIEGGFMEVNNNQVSILPDSVREI